MKKKFSIVLILGFLFFLSLGISSRFYIKKYLIPVPIAGYTRSSLPYIKIDINKKPFFFMLDLGFNKDSSIVSSCLAEIQNKVFEQMTTSSTIRGNRYPIKTYKIPQLQIDRMKFYSVLITEDNHEMDADTRLIVGKYHTAEATAGSLGSTLFKNTCLCLDLYSSMIAFCDSFDTLKKTLKPCNPFSKIPFSFKNGFIEFDITTTEQSLHCILDTGSTWNMINAPHPPHIPLSEFIENELFFEHVKIKDMDFGSITFHPLPFKGTPTRIDAVLGIDFLADHVVFIDFPNREIYFSKATYENIPRV